MTPLQLNGAAQATATLREDTTNALSNMEIRQAAKAQREADAEHRKFERYGKTRIKPVGDSFIIRPKAPRTATDAGIELPEKIINDMRRSQGIVLAIGPGPMVIDGCTVPMPDVQVGDEVIYNARMLTEPDGKEGYEFHVVPAKNICGVIQRPKAEAPSIVRQIFEGAPSPASA